MTSRARTLLLATIVALPCLAFTVPCLGHNGRDAGPRKKVARATAVNADIFRNIVVRTDPRTGQRSYTQVGDVPPNPGPANPVSVPPLTEHGVDFWVGQSFAYNNGGYAPPADYYEPSQHEYASDEGYYSDYGYGYGYGGYYPSLGYGGGGYGRHRPGHGHGGDGHGDDGHHGRPGGGDDRPPHTGGGGSFVTGRLPPRSYSPPPGPYGGGVGSPPPYYDAGVGAPPPAMRSYTFGGGRRR